MIRNYWIKASAVAAKLILIMSSTVLYMEMTMCSFDKILMAAGGNKKIALMILIMMTVFVTAVTSFIVFKGESLKSMILSLYKMDRVHATFLIIFSFLCANYALQGFEFYAYKFKSSFLSISFIKTIMLYPLFVFYLYYIKSLLNRLYGIFKSFTKFEKRFLVIASMLMAIAVIVFYRITDMFYNRLDVFYTTDSLYVMTHDWFANFFTPENDLRNPLFAVFGLPLEVFAKMVSPNQWILPLAIFQFILLIFAVIMLARLVTHEETKRPLFLALICSTFPFLVFSFAQEQYIFGLFCLILFIYNSFNHKEDLAKNIYFTAAAGTISTTAAIFPLLICSKRTWLKDLFMGAVTFIFIACCSGRAALFINVVKEMEAFLQYGGKELSFIEKFIKTLFMIQSFFTIKGTPVLGTDNLYHYWFVSKGQGFNAVGCFILLLAFIGFLCKRKDRFAQVCFGWVILSLAITVGYGYGTDENDKILYGLYFSWATIALVYMAIIRLFGKNAKWILCGIASICAFANFIELFRVLEFGVKYYPF